MRKNRMMRVASALMVAVLLTTCVISSTFAKYVTEDTFADSARVAKWGVELQIVGNLYGDTYIDELTANNDPAIAVQASDATAAEGSDIVAPGTKNENGMTISLNGTPEVDGKVTISITTSNVFLKEGTYGVMIPVKDNVITETNFDEYYATYNTNGKELFVLNRDGTFTAAANFEAETTYYTLEDVCTVTGTDDNKDEYYYPVLYTLGGSSNSSGTNADDTLNMVATTILNQVATGAEISMNASGAVQNGETTYTLANVPFNSNENLATKFNLGGSTLTWAWAFNDQNDGADTILGMLAANQENQLIEGTQIVMLTDTDTYGALTVNEDYCLNSKFHIEITVEQVDKTNVTESTTVAP